MTKLFDTVGPRFGDRDGGYTRIIRAGWQKGDGADKAFIELLGSEQVLDEKRQKRADARAKKAEETKKQMEEAEAAQANEAAVQAESNEEKEKRVQSVAIERGHLARAFCFRTDDKYRWRRLYDPSVKTLTRRIR